MKLKLRKSKFRFDLLRQVATLIAAHFLLLRFLEFAALNFDIEFKFRMMKTTIKNDFEL